MSEVKETNQWLQDAILLYLQNNYKKNPNSVDITCHFKLRVDIILDALTRLEEKDLGVKS